MRPTAGSILLIGTMLAVWPAQAQTYGSNFPICLQTYGRSGGYIECDYTSMAQCRVSASGRAAQCMTNPYFAGADRQVSRRAYRRQHDLGW